MAVVLVVVVLVAVQVAVLVVVLVLAPQLQGDQHRSKGLLARLGLHRRLA